MARRPKDPEAESERRPPAKPDPAKLAKRMEFWRGEIARVGRSDRHGGVYRVGNFDHDGRELSHDELAALHERDLARSDEPDDPLLPDE